MEPMDLEKLLRFPRNVYVLARSASPDEFIMHRDYNEELNYILIFDSMVDADGIARDYSEATGDRAEPHLIDVSRIDVGDKFGVRYYAYDGDPEQPMDMLIEDYRACIGKEFAYDD
jgi:hypothetical protein